MSLLGKDEKAGHATHPGDPPRDSPQRGPQPTDPSRRSYLHLTDVVRY